MASLIQQFPVELLISIFREIDDINDLRSLVLSCSTFYQAFLTDRHNILPPLMNKWYEKKRNIAQAIAAVRSKGLYAEIKSNYHEIVAILDTCRRSDEIEQSASAHILLPETPGNVEETIELLKLSKEAEFLQDFCMNLHPGQAAYWLRPGQWESEILPLKLSDTEKGRLLRAYYRVQTYSNMFGAPEWLPDEPRDSRCLNNWCWGGSSLVDEVYRLFFTTMPQWEAQEFCVWIYIYNRYKPILN
ncbi:hypothetical protein PHISCL_02702 [Aspergillus sclerotialis]|uniref:F-box domain-containing protein n=1 Tax=Aspergillus sclerotialis TaxID=2070753 RepID=A0A3A2ZP06_9EURO|nr:hypothetical protein PHISCL_02702 [Aspergillus sclerotialis]